MTQVPVNKHHKHNFHRTVFFKTLIKVIFLGKSPIKSTCGSLCHHQHFGTRVNVDFAFTFVDILLSHHKPIILLLKMYKLLTEVK